MGQRTTGVVHAKSGFVPWEFFVSATLFLSFYFPKTLSTKTGRGGKIHWRDFFETQTAKYEFGSDPLWEQVYVDHGAEKPAFDRETRRNADRRGLALVAVPCMDHPTAFRLEAILEWWPAGGAGLGWTAEGAGAKTRGRRGVFSPKVA